MHNYTNDSISREAEMSRKRGVRAIASALACLLFISFQVAILSSCTTSNLSTGLQQLSAVSQITLSLITLLGVGISGALWPIESVPGLAWATCILGVIDTLVLFETIAFKASAVVCGSSPNCDVQAVPNAFDSVGGTVLIAWYSLLAGLCLTVVLRRRRLHHSVVT